LDKPQPYFVMTTRRVSMSRRAAWILVRRLESLAVDFGILKSCASGVISPILTPTSSL
jgi:hypothetical protein